MTMRSIKISLALVAALTLAAWAPAATAAIVNPVVDFGSGYAMENGRPVDDPTSTPGDVLTVVGHVVAFNEPFDDLDPNDPMQEYTYVYSDLISLGTVVSGGGSFIFYDTDYAGGVLRVYCDTAMNSDFANPATFMDGDMILEASLSNFHISTKNFNCAGNQNADLLFTGGSLFDRVSVGGVGFDGIITGLFSVCNEQVPDALENMYFGLSDTKIDVNPPTPVENRTWGQLKRLYP